VRLGILNFLLACRHQSAKVLGSSSSASRSRDSTWNATVFMCEGWLSTTHCNGVRDQPAFPIMLAPSITIAGNPGGKAPAGHNVLRPIVWFWYIEIDEVASPCTLTAPLLNRCAGN